MGNPQNRQKSQLYRQDQRRIADVTRKMHQQWQDAFLGRDSADVPPFYTERAAPAAYTATNLYDAVEHAFATRPLGVGSVANAYVLEGPFANHVVRAKRSAMKERLSDTTILYPVRIATQDIGAPLWMNESGTIQIQPLVAGDTLQRRYEQFVEQRTQGSRASQTHAPALAYGDLLKMLLALPDAAYMNLMKKAVSAAQEGLVPDFHASNILIEGTGETAALRALDYDRFDAHRHGDRYKLPQSHYIASALVSLEPSPPNKENPQSHVLYEALVNRIEAVRTQAIHDPEVQAVFDKQPKEKRLIQERLAHSWLDRTQGKAIKDITSLCR